MTSRAVVLLLGAVSLGASSCRQIVGIEDAELDPTLSRSGAGAGSIASLQGASSSGGEIAQAGEGNAGSDGATPSICEQYCGVVTKNCTGAFAVYTSYTTCLAVCAALPEGMPGDSGLNSVQCRLHAASIATDEVPHYCPIAGPGGNGECGSNCESLCGLREQICADYKDSDLTSCLESCAMLQDLGTYSTDLDLDQYRGPHVQCRLYHVSAAAVADAPQHCRHVDGARPCQ